MAVECCQQNQRQHDITGWLVSMRLASVVVPKMLSSFSKADLVHTMKRPTWPPGASCKVQAHCS
jgi:hypothetical protein